MGGGTGGKSTTDVFVEAVEDHLKGEPNARHPVQFEVYGQVGSMTLAMCTLCGVLVGDRELHRKSHDNHNQVHRAIEDAANQYVPPPRYR